MGVVSMGSLAKGEFRSFTFNPTTSANTWVECDKVMSFANGRILLEPGPYFMRIRFL